MAPAALMSLAQKIAVASVPVSSRQAASYPDSRVMSLSATSAGSGLMPCARSARSYPSRRWPATLNSCGPARWATRVWPAEIRWLVAAKAPASMSHSTTSTGAFAPFHGRAQSTMRAPARSIPSAAAASWARCSSVSAIPPTRIIASAPRWRIRLITDNSRSGTPWVEQTRQTRPSATACSSTPEATFMKNGEVMSLTTIATIPEAVERERALALTT